MKTEQEFESYVKELGKQGIRKRKQKIAALTSAAGTMAACLVIGLVVWKSGIWQPIRSDQATEGAVSADQAHEQKQDHLSDIGFMETAAAVGINEAAYEMNCLLEYTENDMVSAQYVSQSAHVALCEWVDSLLLDSMETVSTEPDNGTRTYHFRTLGSKEVYVTDGFVAVDGVWYKLDAEQQDAFDTVLNDCLN